MMKRFIIGAMLILGLCSWVKAQKKDVRIRVVDEWNRPLQGVMMRIGGNDDESFLSDKDGMIECRADKGAELNFEKYNQLQRKLKVTGEVMTVKLDKDNRPIVLEDKCNGCGACESVCVSLQNGSIAEGATARAIVVHPLDEVEG